MTSDDVADLLERINRAAEAESLERINRAVEVKAVELAAATQISFKAQKAVIRRCE